MSPRIRISPPAGYHYPEVAYSWSSSLQPRTVAHQWTTPPVTHSRKSVQSIPVQRCPQKKRARPKRGPRSARNRTKRERCNRYKSRSRSPTRRYRRPRSKCQTRTRCTSRSPRRQRSRSRTDRRRSSLKRRSRIIGAIWRSPSFEEVVPPVDSLQVPHVKKRITPITTDDQLAGDDSCTVEDVQHVLACHSSQQPIGAAVISRERVAHLPQPIQLYPVRTQEANARKQEQDLSLSPLPTSPDSPVAPELGNPSNPPEQPRRRSTQERDRPGCQAGQGEEAAQAGSNCAELTLQEIVNSLTLLF